MRGSGESLVWSLGGVGFLGGFWESSGRLELRGGFGMQWRAHANVRVVVNCAGVLGEEGGVTVLRRRNLGSLFGSPASLSIAGQKVRWKEKEVLVLFDGMHSIGVAGGMGLGWQMAGAQRCRRWPAVGRKVGGLVA